MEDQDYLKEEVAIINILAPKRYKRMLVSKNIKEKDTINNIELISLENFIPNYYLRKNNIV